MGGEGIGGWGRGKYWITSSGTQTIGINNAAFSHPRHPPHLPNILARYLSFIMPRQPLTMDVQKNMGHFGSQPLSLHDIVVTFFVI